MSLYFASLVLILGSIAVYFYRKNQGFRILMYHKVVPNEDTSDYSYKVTTDRFIEHIQLLQSKKYNIISLSEFEKTLEAKKNLPKKSVLLTFDDGWLDNYTHLFPIVKKYKIPVTIFISPGLIAKEDDLMLWEQIKEMKESGWVDFSSHGYSHRRLRSLGDEDINFELQESKKIIEKELGVQLKTFCYAYGSHNKHIRNLVKQGSYLFDFGTRQGVNPLSWNSYRAFKRIHIKTDDSLGDFNRKLISGYKYFTF